MVTFPAVRIADLTVTSLLDEIASERPVPGGGSASAIAAALGASLLSMVARLSLGRERYAEHAPLHAAALEVGETGRIRLLGLADDDAAAYAALAGALRLPRASTASDAARAEAIRTAARKASEVPLSIVGECRTVVAMVEQLVGRSNANAASDLDVAALLLEAASRGAAANVVVNLPYVKDGAFTEATLANLTAVRAEIASAAARVHEGTHGA